jgi:glucose-6-phosphate isomerase
MKFESWIPAHTPIQQPFSAQHAMFQYKVSPTPALVKDWLSQYRTFVVIGMGGSILPLKSLVDAFDLSQQIKFIDHLDYARIHHWLQQEHTAFCVVSKSGETLEVKTLMDLFLASPRRDDLLFVTDPVKGTLRKWVNQEKRLSLEIPPEIGGRFTQFTPLHRALIERCGLDFESWLLRAQKTRDQLVRDSGVLATLLSSFQSSSVASLVLWAYGGRGLGFAQWAQQALAESLGKRSPSGQRHGFLPVVLQGPQDQHSVLQLLMDGPQNNALWFFEDEAIDPQEPDALTRCRRVLCESTVQSFVERLQNSETAQSVVRWRLGLEDRLDWIDLVVIVQALVEFTGHAWGIDAFNQPGVERGKQIARELMR